MYKEISSCLFLNLIKKGANDMFNLLRPFVHLSDKVCLSSKWLSFSGPINTFIR